METIKAELAQFQTLKDLRSILEAEGPCLSVFAQLNSQTKALQWKEALRAAEPRLKAAGAEGKGLLDGLADLDWLMEQRPAHCKSVAIFRSAEIFRVVWLSEKVKSQWIVGQVFYIRPLLPELTKPQTFYILALSQRDVRLLRCTSSTSEEVVLASNVATNYDVYMNTAKPDHERDTLSSAGPSSGSSKGIVSNFDTEREDKSEHLTHFFRQIDLAVAQTLRGITAPVVLAGVDYETALYRTLSTYPHLSAESVHGAPNGLKAGEMHARAIEAITKAYVSKVESALAEYNHKVGSGGSDRIAEVVPAAHDGRVLTLLASDSIEKTGSYDAVTDSVKKNATTEESTDLVNDAAVQTILHAGHVVVIPDNKMPAGAAVAAIYRF